MIIEKLDTIIGFLAIRGLEETGTTKRLLDLGISDRSIAKVLGLTDNTWAARKSRLKKAEPKPKAKTKPAAMVAAALDVTP
jgi:hypothetical protein